MVHDAHFVDDRTLSKRSWSCPAGFGQSPRIVARALALSLPSESKEKSKKSSERAASQNSAACKISRNQHTSRLTSSSFGNSSMSSH